VVGKFARRRSRQYLERFLPHRSIEVGNLVLRFVIDGRRTILEGANLVSEIQDEDDVGRLASQLSDCPWRAVFDDQQVFRLEIANAVAVQVVGAQRQEHLTSLDSRNRLVGLSGNRVRMPSRLSR